MIIVDSSYFIALADKRDQWHGKASELKEFVQRNEVMITNLIVSEVLTELGRRKGGKAGNLLYTYFKDNCKILYPNDDDFDNAESIYLKFDGKLSIPDSLSVFYMNKLSISKIVSFDSDFDKIKNIKRIFNF
jgi:predicted nucleic acid-binding protein